jgi:hypothetical protein
MSGNHGDKARFGRARKKKTLRQKRSRELMVKLSPENKGARVELAKPI